MFLAIKECLTCLGFLRPNPSNFLSVVTVQPIVCKLRSLLSLLQRKGSGKFRNLIKNSIWKVHHRKNIIGKREDGAIKKSDSARGWKAEHDSKQRNCYEPWRGENLIEELEFWLEKWEHPDN